MQLAEYFFSTHEATKEANELQEISFSLKRLLVKMLAINPLKRYRLIDLVENDDWILQGPPSTGPLNICQYTTQMREIYQTLSSEAPIALSQISEEASQVADSEEEDHDEKYESLVSGVSSDIFSSTNQASASPSST